MSEVLTPQVTGFISPALKPTEHKENTFSMIRQGTATNSLTKTRTKSGNYSIDDVTGKVTVKRSGFIVTMEGLNSIDGLKNSTFKLLDALSVVFTENGAKSPDITMSLDDYMSKCGLKDKKEARKQVKADLETLFNARISFKEKRKKGESQDFADVRICEAKGIKNGVITFSFSATFYKLMLGYPVMPLHPLLWRLGTKRNDNSLCIFRKLLEHKNMNYGKKNEDTIAVKTLLENAPYLPSYDEVMQTGRQLTQRIIEPLERDLNGLEEALKWNYCHRNNEPLTDEELANFSYALFKELLVKVSWNDYPDQSKRLEQKAEKLNEEKAKKKRTYKKKAEPEA